MIALLYVYLIGMTAFGVWLAVIAIDCPLMGWAWFTGWLMMTLQWPRYTIRFARHAWTQRSSR